MSEIKIQNTPIPAEQCSQAAFKGSKDSSIFGFMKKLQEEKIDIESCSEDEQKQVIIVTGPISTESLIKYIADFPDLKAVAFLDSFQPGHIRNTYIVYSENGQSDFSKFKYIGWCDGQSDDPFSQQAYIFSVENKVYTGIHSMTGDRWKITYSFPFEFEWNDDGMNSYFISKDGILDCHQNRVLTINDGVQSVKALINTNHLEEINIPASLEEFRFLSVVGTGYSSRLAGEECDCLLKINVNPKNHNFTSMNGILYSKDMSEILIIPNGLKGAYEIPDGIQELKDHSIYGAGIQTIVIPASIMKIKPSAFYRMKNLKKFEVNSDNKNFTTLEGLLVNKKETDLIAAPNRIKKKYTVPAGLKKIMSHAFCGNEQLSTVTLPEGIKSIGTGAFTSCPKLKNIYIPSSVTKIAKGAFDLPVCGRQIKIHGKEGSFAQKFAKEEEYLFVPDYDV